MALRDPDPFASLNRVLDSRHTLAGSIRKACYAVEDCVVNNRCLLRHRIHSFMLAYIFQLAI